MNTKFISLFTFRVTHKYYGGDDVTCPDFDFALAEHSQRALAGARLLARVHGGRLHILYEADENGLPMQDIDGLELIIGLRLCNPYFEYFTAALPEPLPLYANTTSTPKTLIAPQASDLIAHRFEPAATMTQRPLTLSISRMRDNAQVWSGEIKDGESMPKIDMRSWEAGCYLVKQQSGIETHTRPLIHAPDLAETGMWGIVRIVVTPDFWKPSSPPDFLIGFDACKDELEYYMVAPPGDLANLSVKDTTQNTPLAFDKIAHENIPANITSPMLLGANGAKVVLFRSTSKIQRSSTASRHIQLRRNGDTLVKNLPLPSADMPSARFVVHLSKL